MNAKNDKLNNRLASISGATPAYTQEPEHAGETNRSIEREKTFRVGQVLLPDNSKLNCVVKDLSASGALVVLEGAISIPKCVTLLVPQSGLHKMCEVVRQDGAEVGVQFFGN